MKVAPIITGWTVDREPEIAAFVADHPQGMIYYTPAFRRYLLAMLGGECRSMLAFEDGRLTGVLPLLAKSGPYGAILNSLPFFGSNGGILATSAAAEIALRAEYERVAAKDVVASTWISHPFMEVVPPQHDLTDERIAQWTELPSGGLDALFPNIDSSARRNVQRALAEGVTVRETPEALGFLEKIHRENMGAIGGRAKPREFFSCLDQTMTYGRDWRLYLAERGGEELAALLTFEASQTVEYVMPVVKETARGLQPTAAILSRAMGDAIARGFTRWNWGGTWLTQQGVYRFKKKWGALERRYHYYITLNDTALRHHSAAGLTEAYPWFYTLPYAALTPTETI